MLFGIAIASIALGFLSAIFIAIDEARRPQKMGIMNVVWPVSALYFSVIAVWAYLSFGRAKPPEAQPKSMSHDNEGGVKRDRREPTPAQVAKGTAHCGAGCMLADVFCEFGIAAAGLTLFGSRLWAEFAIDFAVAWAVGIVFQYFALRPMREGSTGGIVAAAIKADTLSILAFQVGMYAWMSVVYFLVFPHPHLTPFQPQYWLMMQVAMVLGFATSYPMNRLLIRHGLKEAM
jgi:putative flippase GtrA